MAGDQYCTRRSYKITVGLLTTIVGQLLALLHVAKSLHGPYMIFYTFYCKILNFIVNSSCLRQGWKFGKLVKLFGRFDTIDSKVRNGNDTQKMCDLGMKLLKLIYFFFKFYDIP